MQITEIKTTSLNLSEFKMTVATDDHTYSKIWEAQYCDFSISLWLHYIVPFKF